MVEAQHTEKLVDSQVVPAVETFPGESSAHAEAQSDLLVVEAPVVDRSAAGVPGLDPAVANSHP